MRRVTQIGWIALAASAACALAASSSSAEARGFRLRLGIGSATAATPVPLPPRLTQRIANAGVPLPVATSSAITAPAIAAPVLPRITPAPQAPAPVVGLTQVTLPNPAERARAPEPPVHVAGPWCPSGRVVGAGAGFCAIN